MKKSEKILLSAALSAATVYYLKKRQVRLPKGVKPVKNFEILKFIGTWNVIAKLNPQPELPLSHISFDFSPNERGGLKVKSKGFDEVSETWTSSIGEMQFVGKFDKARFKMSFYKPLWFGFNVISIDEDYRYALVAGNSLKYLWILSKEASVPQEVRDEFLLKATRLGYNTAELVWVFHQ
ncbi:lipocalin family protein [Elizabethkingia sp. JS20170427COW]|uniref:lipocalin family protein n=1 Tax=Elizabethkingia sp. JS20170427COW TaxID=2583851 RepID=UPI0011109DB8|nr:lipocalin family protein [Elizabethkingia sp. JS20170427COW]QCX52545.1 lipocalin [Elizabethkingia sp. JS20170427COW]